MYEIFYNKKLYTDLLVTNFAKYNMVWVRRIISLFIFKKIEIENVSLSGYFNGVCRILQSVQYSQLVHSS